MPACKKVDDKILPYSPYRNTATASSSPILYNRSPVKEEDGYYLEDMNSTNGTFKNGLRMQPYEKRKLEEGDEITFGKRTLIYR